VEVAMLLAASEGRHWRYEVCEHADGYIVQMRDLETGDLDDEFSTIFRTMPVAFAYAEMSAAYERYAASEIEIIDDAQIEIDVEETERHFMDLSDRLHDNGINDVLIQTWNRESKIGAARLLH
jgi:transcriptional/translational regulatory protein YebC/TACO1